MTQILAMDVHYGDQMAVVAGVLFSSWSAEQADDEMIHTVPIISDYIPGQFYLRELPCLQVLLEQLDSLPDLIVVDGYVYLGAENKPGLGWYLWQALDKQVPVIGVAKSKYQGTPESTHVCRGESLSPIYVTAVGAELEFAKASVAKMAGSYRKPDLLKRVDQLCRNGLDQVV